MVDEVKGMGTDIIHIGRIYASINFRVTEPRAVTMTM
jgi:hypothetical protein